ncbi:hypothetical protein OAP55_00065 [Alphaproteobacteria bacterium]|nr:hypothetical protein [Alphaproteobacteria bacterium]
MTNFSDPQIWVAIAFILFFAFCGKFIWTKLSSFLDAQIKNIKTDISEAQKLHDEAKKLLTNEIKKFQDLEKEIKKILKDGKIQEQELQKENTKSIAEEIEKLEKASLEKISYLENQVVNEIRNKIAKKAVSLTQDFFTKELDSNIQLENINSSVDEIERSLKNKNSLL